METTYDNPDMSEANLEETTPSTNIKVTECVKVTFFTKEDVRKITSNREDLANVRNELKDIFKKSAY